MMAMSLGSNPFVICYPHQRTAAKGACDSRPRSQRPADRHQKTRGSLHFFPFYQLATLLHRSFVSLRRLASFRRSNKNRTEQISLNLLDSPSHSPKLEADSPACRAVLGKAVRGSLSPCFVSDQIYFLCIFRSKENELLLETCQHQIVLLG